MQLVTFSAGVKYKNIYFNICNNVISQLSHNFELNTVNSTTFYLDLPWYFVSLSTYKCTQCTLHKTVLSTSLHKSVQKCLQFAVKWQSKVSNSIAYIFFRPIHHLYDNTSQIGNLIGVL